MSSTAVTTTSDELTTPLGVDRDETRTRSGHRVVPVAAGVVATLLAGLIGSVSLFGDPLGGRPYARVEIGQAAKTPALPPQPAQANAAAPKEPTFRQTARDVESASGVSVLRPQGTNAPGAVIVRVPDDVVTTLNPAPDERLVDKTRYGVLPRIGSDGARALDVYARPAGFLPGGREPVGRVALMVGGLGISQSATAEAISKLPAPVTLAFAPYGNELERMAASARANGHEILLQVPMEPFDYPDSDPGPHTLTTAAKPAENMDHLQWVLGRLTGYVGIVNYMGGKFTADERALAPILRDAGARGLAVLDDGSSSRSVLVSSNGNTPAARADAVVDAVPRADLIDAALAKLESKALTGTVAIGSASALPVSVERIGRWARGLEARGILLVPVSAALRTGARGSASR